VHLHGKTRKDRSVPLWQSTAAAVRAWLHANPVDADRKLTSDSW
jgi:site-specific recombinase XerC